MMSKEQKKNYVEEMKKVFSSNEAVMIAHYKGKAFQKLFNYLIENHKELYSYHQQIKKRNI